MVATPYLLVAVVGFFIYRGLKKAQRAAALRAASQTGEPDTPGPGEVPPGTPALDS
jgi:hypothetical protein